MAFAVRRWSEAEVTNEEVLEFVACGYDGMNVVVGGAADHHLPRLPAFFSPAGVSGALAADAAGLTYRTSCSTPE